jgi:hypothetical protein
MNTLRTGQTRRSGSIVRRAIGTAAAMMVATSMLISAPASAGSPGTFNIAECMPGTQQIKQQIEVYRSYAGEYVALQGALYNATTGSVTLSQWAWGEGATAYTAFTWPATSGSYAVFYHWASWNPQTSQWSESGWIQLAGAQVITFGANETMEGSGIYISQGENRGYCQI